MSKEIGPPRRAGEVSVCGQGKVYDSSDDDRRTSERVRRGNRILAMFASGTQTPKFSARRSKTPTNSHLRKNDKVPMLPLRLFFCASLKTPTPRRQPHASSFMHVVNGFCLGPRTVRNYFPVSFHELRKVIRPPSRLNVAVVVRSHRIRWIPITPTAALAHPYHLTTVVIPCAADDHGGCARHRQG